MDKIDFIVFFTLIAVLGFLGRSVYMDTLQTEYQTTLDEVKFNVYLNTTSNMTPVDKISLINKYCAESFDTIKDVNKCRTRLISNLINGDN